MTNYKIAVRGAAAAVFTLLASASAFAAAHPGDGVRCLLSRNFSDVHRVVTICVGRSAEAQARLGAADCDPATMSDPAMRALCAAITGERPAHFGNHPGGAGGR